ncbi:MAG: iron-containing alcohol dehydrogenase [Verrucomicrobia bacterium]|nr:iron-containing alcohol dehydrogenase [Verrucomicrobiota bacterium]
MHFEFVTAPRIVFGVGAVRELGGIVRSLGQRVLVVTGRNGERARPALEQLAQQDLAATPFQVPGEPTTHRVTAGVEVARSERCDVVVAFGGGSAIDAGKAIAALLTNGGEVLDYLEVIGQARPLTQPAAPVIAIPTTAGTGCEVTRNAVLLSPEHHFKASLRSSFLMPRVAVVDPELARNLPRELTACTGLDALTQLIEPFVGLRANPMTDAVCREGLRRAARSLGRACEEPDDLVAREDMAVASLFSGMALANAGLGAVHGFAAPLGWMFPAPHGAVCAALLPHVMEMNVRALAARSPRSESLRRYDEVARLLTGHAAATAAEGIRWVAKLCAKLAIPKLGRWGIRAADLPAIVDKATQASSMKANPIVLTKEELAEVLVRAI